MSVKIFKTCAVAACVGLAASVALADPNGAATVANPYGQIDVAPGEVYVGAAGGVSWMTLPGWDYGGGFSATIVDSIFDIDGDGRLYGGQAWAGMGIDAGPGKHTRIQLEGSYAEGDLDGRQFRPDAGIGDAFIGLDAGSDTTVNGASLATLEVDVRGWEVGLRALTEERTDTSGAFTPSLMVFGGAASQDYDANMFDELPCDPDCREHFARQDVDAWYVGVEGALTATANLTPALTVTLGGRVAGLYFDADMDGEGCQDNNGAVPGCDGAQGRSSVSDGLSVVTYRGGGFGGLSYDLGGASVGIMATADVVPMADIVNPRFAVGAGDSPSHLDLSHELVYGVRGSIVIPLTGSAAKDLREAGIDLREAVKDLREAFVAKGRSVWAALMPGHDERGR